MLASGRATFEFGRVGFAPAFLGRVHTRFGTPANALVINMIIGMIALATGRTAEIITISVFGALTLYAVSMVAMLRLRRTEPGLQRPFKTPFYPAVPLAALVISTVSLIALTVFNPWLAIIYFALIGLCYGIFKVWNVRSTGEINS
jgi:ethanolamine permease